MADEDVILEEGTVEDPSENTDPEGSSTEGSDKGKARGGFQARISELTAKAKLAESEAEGLRDTLRDRDKELKDLVDLLKEKEEDSRVVRRIQELHSTDPAMKDLIETLDRRVRGEEVEVPGAKSEGKPANSAEFADGLSKKEAKALLDSQASEISDELADVRAELLLTKAEGIIEKVMKELPAEYSEVDRNRIGSVLNSHIDWDGIENEPSKINDLIVAGVQSAVNWYGEPTAPANTQGDNSGPAKKVLSAAERLERLTNQEYGKVELVETTKGKRMKATVSDEDFTDALAQALRLEREARNSS